MKKTTKNPSKKLFVKIDQYKIVSGKPLFIFSTKINVLKIWDFRKENDYYVLNIGGVKEVITLDVGVLDKMDL